MPDRDQRDSMTTKILNRFAWLVFITAAFTYALIVFGGVVRITGSGMGCGDDWPLCNGQLIPPMDFETLIEYSHRLAAALVSIMVFVVAAYAIRHRKVSGFAARRVVGLAIASAVLLVIQVLVGAITVWLELPTSTVVLHLGLALTLLATLLVAGLRARVEASPEAQERTGAAYKRWALAAAALGFVVLLFGALVANTGAAPLCQGFPLCNGRLFPQGGGLVHLHWTHRLLAYAELVVIVTAVIATLRHKAPAAVSRWAIVALGLLIGQIWVAAELVARQLPPNLRGLHLAVGVALWAALVVWAALAQREVPDSLPGSAG
ncbi:MAG: COX15/CtaA family protein [Gemmatimonadota bacterium]